MNCSEARIHRVTTGWILTIMRRLATKNKKAVFGTVFCFELESAYVSNRQCWTTRLKNTLRGQAFLENEKRQDPTNKLRLQD